MTHEVPACQGADEPSRIKHLGRSDGHAGTRQRRPAKGSRRARRVLCTGLMGMDTRLDKPRMRAGRALGEMLAPAAAALSRWREARMFHPEGHTFAGYSAVADGPFHDLACELAGRVLARCSAALWREWEHFDVLGMALRLRPGHGPDLDATPVDGDQDLLMATIRSPFTMLASPLFTDPSDFACNRYWAVSPFDCERGRVELRLSPVGSIAPQPGNRVQRLARAVRDGQAVWWLQARRTLTLGWHKVLRIQLDHEVDVDQEALAFDPFRGVLRPVGVVHEIRRAVYDASQHARPRGAT